MAARRCLIHGSFPAEMKYQKCPVCYDPTDYIANADPDEFWEQNIARHREFIIAVNEPVPDIPTLEGAKVHLTDDQYWLSTNDVINGGLRHQLRDTDLVQVGKQVFEVLHYSYELRRYFVQPFAVELSDEDLSKLAGP